MARVDPEGPRFSIVDRSDSIRVEIPAQRNWFYIVFLLVWVGLWTYFEFFLITSAANRPIHPIAWTLGGLWAMFCLSWILYGREVVLIELPSRLTVQEQLFGRRIWSQEFKLAEAINLRPATELQDPINARFQLTWRVGKRKIAFDYGARTYRFGAGMDDAEAEILVYMLTKRYPAFAQTTADRMTQHT